MLNALRHQRKNHLQCVSRFHGIAECAQRLTASKEESRVDHRFEFVLVRLCSTPYGIKGRITDACYVRCLRVSVLNALRHQRKNHSTRSDFSNAQAVVLNALRHQRKNHAANWPQRRMSIDVLNALRHQRKNHVCSTVLSELEWMCSTPYGIKGRITGMLERLRRRMRPVLNALRHQRKNHALTADGLRSAWQVCSTPYGIKGRITLGVGRERILAVCAQRLTASKEESRPCAVPS